VNIKLAISQPVADDHVTAPFAGAEISGDPAADLAEGRFVDGHDVPPDAGRDLVSRHAFASSAPAPRPRIGAITQACGRRLPT